MKKSAKTSKATCVRTHLFKVDARCNAGKLGKLEALDNEWKRMLPIAGGHLWGKFLAGDLPGKSLSSKVGPDSVFGRSPLVASVKQCMAVAIEGQVKTWKSNFANRAAKLIMASEKYSLDEQARHRLLWINSMGLWLAPIDEQRRILAEGEAAKKTKAGGPLDRESRLLRRYAHAYLRKFKAPSFEGLPLQVNSYSSTWSDAQDTELEGVAHWLRVSTLERRQTIALPIRANAYAAAIEGSQLTTFSIFKKPGKGRKPAKWLVKACKALPKAEPRAGSRILGLDIGMSNLLATSQGAIYRKGFIHELKKWDAKLVRIARGLQNAGEMRLGQCRRYKEFARKFREWMRSEIGHAVNQALALGEPSFVAIEALAFSSQEGGLSRRMNRLARRMGAGIFKASLESKSETQGFRVGEVNAAYSSQECNSCGFMSRKNRNGNKFKCVCCGRRAHADASAARNLAERLRQGWAPKPLAVAKLRGQGLERWASNLVARLPKESPPSSLRREGVVGDARAGLRELSDGKGIPLAVRGILSRLPEGIWRGLDRSSDSNGLSTRYSGEPKS